MARRVWLILILASVTLIGLTAVFRRDVFWLCRFLLQSKPPTAVSSQALPTCLGCTVKVVFLDGAFKVGALLKSAGLQEKVLKKSFLFGRAYANSLDPLQNRACLLNLKYPTRSNPQYLEKEPTALTSILKTHGYSLEIQTWTVTDADGFEQRWNALNAKSNTLVLILSLLGTTEHESLRAAQDNAIRIPLLIYHSEAQNPGPIDDLISLVDVGPMLLNLLGAPAPNFAEGRSLMNPEPDRPVYGRGPGLEFVFDGNWKVIRKSRGDLHVFYLPLDPSESEDLAGLVNPWAKQAIMRLTAEMDRWSRTEGEAAR